MQTFLDSADDMEWLRATCLRGVTLPTAWHDFASAILHGNEDAPDRVDLYMSREPTYTDSYLRVTFNHAAPIYCKYEIVSAGARNGGPKHCGYCGYGQCAKPNDEACPRIPRAAYS